VAQVVKAADGRGLSLEIAGDPDGKPIFLFHGTPGSRIGPRPRGIVLYRRGIRLISYDRPGYGDSDRQPGRTVRDAAADVRELADALDIDRFSVVGRSGGAPHALACAAILGDRVERAAALGSLAPCDAEGLDWWDGMAESNVRAYRAARAGLAQAERENRPQAAEEAMRGHVADLARQVRRDPESLLRSLGPELVSHDRKVVGDVALRRLIAENHAKALGDETAVGWIDDILALASPWGFNVSDIAVPVMLWHGTNDVFSPVGHTHWLHKEIKKCTLDEPPDAAHFGTVEMLPEILTWVAPARPRRVSAASLAR
jgi:pimeloyl-ACP methyl ester carboxylesterase